MTSEDNTGQIFEMTIDHTEHFQNMKMYDDAIKECIAAVEWAVDNNSVIKEMQARNLLASLYWSKEDVPKMISQYDTVINIAREHGLIFSEEYIYALFHFSLFLTRVQPVPLQLFSMMKELIEIRSKMVDDENDRDLQSYQALLDSLNMVYKRKKRLRKVKKYVYTKIVHLNNKEI